MVVPLDRAALFQNESLIEQVQKLVTNARVCLKKMTGIDQEYNELTDWPCLSTSEAAFLNIYNKMLLDE